MLQWMGGSRRKVSTSQKSLLKRQKQYFEQRRQQHKYHPQPSKLKSDIDGVVISKEYEKEHRSLDVLNLLNLSTIAQECNSASTVDQTKDIGIKASTTRDPLETNTGFAAKSVEIKETSIPSGFQVDSKSPKKVSSTAPDSDNIGFNGVGSASHQWNNSSEQLFSVFDLLDDNGLNSNVEEKPECEAHVAFSVEGLGKVGVETPVRSPQQQYRTFSYGCSSHLKDARQRKTSKNLNPHLYGLESEMDATMQDINLPFSSSCLDFSMGAMDSLSCAKEKSFTVRDRRHLDNHGGKLNDYISHRNFFEEDESSMEDKWNARFSFQDSFFDERVHDVACKRKFDGNSVVNNLKFGGYDMSEFTFEDPCLPSRRAAPKETEFNILETTASYSKHQASEFDQDFATTYWDRHQTEQRSFDFKPVASQSDRFCFVTEDAKDNFSLPSEEESSSSSAVRGWTTDKLMSHSSSRQSRRKHENAFFGSGDKYDMKATFVKEAQYIGRDSIQQGNVMNDSENAANMLKQSYPKPSSLFEKKLGPKDIWSFEEGCTTDNIYPASSSFNQDTCTKHPSSGPKFLNEDPFCTFPSRDFSAISSLDGFEPVGLVAPVAHSPSDNYISGTFSLNKSSIPDFPLHFEMRDMPLDSLHAASSHCEKPSPSSSAQESFSKDVGYKEKLRPVIQENFDLGKNVFVGNEDMISQEVATVASNSREEVSECRGTNFSNPTLTESVNTASSPKNEEETSPSVEIPYKLQSTEEKKEDHRDAKIPHPCQKGYEDVEDIGREGKTASKQKSKFNNSPCQVVMLQSYVFQLLCVQNIMKDTSTNNATKKL